MNHNHLLTIGFSWWHTEGKQGHLIGNTSKFSELVFVINYHCHEGWPLRVIERYFSIQPEVLSLNKPNTITSFYKGGFDSCGLMYSSVSLSKDFVELLTNMKFHDDDNKQNDIGIKLRRLDGRAIDLGRRINGHIVTSPPPEWVARRRQNLSKRS